MWNALFKRKVVFRFSLQQFETDDGCFFKRRNRVSNLTAQKKLLYDLNLGRSPNFLRRFPYYGVLLSYGSAGGGTCGTHIIYIYIYFCVCACVYMCVCVKEEQPDKYKVCFQLQIWIIYNRNMLYLSMTSNLANIWQSPTLSVNNWITIWKLKRFGFRDIWITRGLSVNL